MPFIKPPATILKEVAAHAMLSQEQEILLLEYFLTQDVIILSMDDFRAHGDNIINKFKDFLSMKEQ